MADYKEARISAAKPVYLQPSAGDAAYNAASQMDAYMTQALNISRENSAFNASEAAAQRDWSSQEAELTRQFNSAEAAKNRDWQAEMSNTAHQREVRDLMAAGLNPVLSAMNGNGAVVGSGATASSSMPTGESGKADTSANAAIASLLGSSLTAMTRLAEMSVSAETSRAVADKYTAAQELAALISADASKYGTDLMSAASIYGSDTHASATRYSAEKSLQATLGAAGIHADATRYAADNSLAAALESAAATRYASDNSRAASELASLRSYWGTRYSSDKSSEASKYASNQSSAASRYGSDTASEASHYSTDKNYSADLQRTYTQLFSSLLHDLMSAGNPSGSGGAKK